MRRSLFAGVALAVAVPAGAQTNVTLSANLVNSCTLALSTGGTMRANTAGTQIGSENAGGTAATMTMVAIGGSPTLAFGAPSLTTSPAGWSATPTVSIKYSSLGGASQGYTSSSSTTGTLPLADTFTVHGKVDSATGFAAGNYVVTTVVTCSQ